MKLIKTIRNDAIMVVALCAAGYLAYKFLLDDRAKKEISSLANTVKDSYDTLTKAVNDRIGTIMDEEVVTQNREQIENAWESIGF